MSKKILLNWWLFDGKVSGNVFTERCESHTYTQLELTHYGWEMHIYSLVNLSVWHQAIIWTSDYWLPIEPSGTNFSEISIKKNHFSLKKMTFKMSSVKLPPFCLGLNVFINTVSAVALQAEHYNDVIMSMMVFCFKSPASWLFTQPFIQAQIKENIKAPRHWPLCGKFTGDRWIPCTKGQ